MRKLFFNVRVDVILAIMLVSSLVACGTQRVKVPDPVVAPQKETVVIPPELLKDCDALPRLTQKTYTQGEEVDKIFKPWSDVHDKCAKNHKALADLARKAFNIPPTQNQKQSSK